MQSFSFKDGQLFAEDVAVRDLARQYGTPLYIYSRSHMREQYRALALAMAEVFLRGNCSLGRSKKKSA